MNLANFHPKLPTEVLRAALEIESRAKSQGHVWQANQA
jgi:hypothetical protein